MRKFYKILRLGRTRPVFIYSFSLITTLFTFILVSLLIYSIHDASHFLFFILPVILNAWYGGIRPGLLTVFISTIAVFMLFLIPMYQSFLLLNDAFYLDLVNYILIGVLVSFVIDFHKQPDQSIAYEKLIQEYIHLLAKLDKNYKKAQEEIIARDEFLAVASHELKTPVTSMLLQVQAALHNIRNVSLAKFSVANLLQMLNSTEQQSKRLSKMVNDLLNTSLITTGRLELELENVDLAKTARDVSHRFSEKLKKEHIDLLLTADKPIFGQLDKLRIEQVVTNLLSNAIKYGGGKLIKLSVTNSNSRGHIIVQDQGIGIPADLQEKIFGRFKRGVSPNEYRGLGVGLYITDQIVKAHKGKINVTSKEGKGTTFTIELPLKRT